MHIDAATPADVPAATACMVAAFADDPITGFFFHDSPLGRAEATSRFFALLLEARLALGMPAYVARGAWGIGGLVMGYDTRRPDWPGDIQTRWDAFEAAHRGLAGRFAAYETIAKSSNPVGPHYVLGALGVDPLRQGKGLGKALVLAFLAQADRDPAQPSVVLETATSANLAFYGSLGFTVTGSGPLGTARLWCLFRPKPGRKNP